MIQIEHVSKTFSGKYGTVHALDDVSIHVEKGDICGIIGFSGAGKSTLIRLVNGLETADSGKVTVCGKELSTLKKPELRALRRKIGMVFQQFNLLESKTVYHNIALPLILAKTPKVEIDKKVKEVLKIVELEDKKDTYISQLSGGQKQRVGIARALTTDPELLLCDEATSALDPQTTESILKLLKKINRKMGVTILLITHQMQVVQMICNKVAVMESGKIVESGSVLEVFGSPKMPVTKRFVQTVIRDQIPDSIISLVKEQKENFRVDRLKFIGSSVKRPVISDICKTKGVVVNILGAAVQELEDSVMCVFILQLIGDDESIDKAEAEIDKNGVLRERLRWSKMEELMKTKIFKVTVERLLLNGGQTLYMVGWSLLIGTIIGMILALILVLCRKGGLVENRPLYMIVSVYINVVRSIPFAILLVTIMPITRAIVGTTIGSTAALVPLVVYISPYLARLMENSLLEIDPGILEAAEAMGATTWQVIRYFLVPETLGSMVLALTTGTIGLLGASAMAGYVGGGGVGDLALTYGYEKMNTPLMILTVVILVVLVQLLQILGNTISGKLRQHK